MKCLMFGLACDQDQFDSYIQRNSNPYSVAHYLFETSFIENFEKYYKISHNYLLQTNNQSLKHAVVQPQKTNITKDTKTNYINYINLPIIKYISLFISTCVRIKDFKKKNDDTFFVLSTINYLPIALATCLMTHIYKCKNIIIFTDCSVGYAYDSCENVSIKQFLKKIYKKVVHIIENQYDAYILFSEPMNQLVNHKNKPHCVMEGFFNSKGLDLSYTEKYENFIILYAGSLIENLGIQNIIDAFKKINSDKIELWIAGDGPYKEKLVKYSLYDRRIKFLGYINHAELFNIEKKVSLVINARDPRKDYTKYSFPSKTFEYLVSGTPFLSTKLACYSEEYEQYIWFIKDNSTEAILNGINKIMETSKSELIESGKKSKEFIKKNKTPEIQVNKVINFIKEIL